MLILWFILCDYIFATNIQIRRTDCTIKCDHFEENIAFETCLKICAGTAAHTPYRLDDNDSIIGRSELFFFFFDCKNFSCLACNLHIANRDNMSIHICKKKNFFLNKERSL